MKPFDIFTIWALLFTLCLWFWGGLIYVLS